MNVFGYQANYLVLVLTLLSAVLMVFVGVVRRRHYQLAAKLETVSDRPTKIVETPRTLTGTKAAAPMRHAFALALAVTVVSALWGCANEDFPKPLPSPSPSVAPPRTLVYADALQQGGPGYVDVYQPPADVTSSAYSVPAGSLLGRPSIIAIHGGLWRSGGRWELGSVASDFASNGYVVFAPDYSFICGRWDGERRT